jgi:hypothetical protein
MIEMMGIDLSRGFYGGMLVGGIIVLLFALLCGLFKINQEEKIVASYSDFGYLEWIAAISGCGKEGFKNAKLHMEIFLDSGNVYYDYLIDRNGKFKKSAKINSPTAYKLCTELGLRNEHLMVHEDEKFINVVKSLLIIGSPIKRSAYASIIFGRRGHDVERMIFYLEKNGFDCSYSS